MTNKIHFKSFIIHYSPKLEHLYIQRLRCILSLDISKLYIFDNILLMLFNAFLVLRDSRTVLVLIDLNIFNIAGNLFPESYVLGLKILIFKFSWFYVFYHYLFHLYYLFNYFFHLHRSLDIDWLNFNLFLHLSRSLNILSQGLHS